MSLTENERTQRSREAAKARSRAKMIKFAKMTAEARRLSQEMPEEGLPLSIWAEEVKRRSGEHEYILHILHNLEGEVHYSLSNVTRLSGLKEADPEYLSEYTLYDIPEDAELDNDVLRQYDKWSILNTQRAYATQTYIQSQLDAGNEILMRKPDGTVEVIHFSI
jgi:hypothetical protein